ncbi:TTN [Mytilus coruscus]|uniref:TTN n=1 Tax=Mytilus coruscus TaxID=42192 RepID=A0A6J8ARN9_MYTCO|nr:TTN [Mytilus coruscus]
MASQVEWLSDCVNGVMPYKFIGPVPLSEAVESQRRALKLFWKITFSKIALTIKGPGENIRLIEGQSFKLQYILPTKRFRLLFLKNNSNIAEKEHVEKNVFHIRKVAPIDEGNYCAKVENIRSTITQLTVQSMFTSSFEQIYCIEGEQLQLKCSVYSASTEVEWFKDNANQYKQDKIERNKNISIDHNGKDHVLTIQNAKITDSGKYIIIAGNVRKQLPVIVKAFFKRPLENKTIMEGVEVSFECEAEKTYNVAYPVAWFKDNHEINSTSKFKKETIDNKVHKLTIQPTTLEDKGKYWIKVKDISSCADLDVKEIPDAVKQMSEHNRNMFLKAAKTGTAVRYYIRIMIVGENGVGKTCLLRRLMNEHIDDVKSTDGINIEVKKCKINRHTQKWMFTTDEEFSKTAYQNEDFADCGFWDFAGQKEFYATHQTFLSTNAIYLLVVDISKDFASKTHQDMIDDKFDKVGGN